MTCGIYEIWIENYFYQGSSNNIERRIYHHKNNLEKSKHDNVKMQNVFNKYKTFEYQILAECDEDALFKYEQDYIDANWGDEKYLNLNSIAAKPPSNKGKKMSLETKHKLSEAKKGKTTWSKGKTFSDEHKLKMSESRHTKGYTKGYTWRKDLKKFKANIWIDGKAIYLGLFEKEEDARQAYLAAREKYLTDSSIPKPDAV